MSATTVTARCAEIQADIAGVNRGFDLESTPNDLSNVQLPAFTNFPNNAEYEEAGSGHAVETITYGMFLWIEPINAPVDAARKGRLFGQYAPLVRDAFLARPRLGQLTGVRKAELTTISEPQVQPYAGTSYLVLVATLRVAEQVNVIYCDGD